MYSYYRCVTKYPCMVNIQVTFTKLVIMRDWLCIVVAQDAEALVESRQDAHIKLYKDLMENYTKSVKPTHDPTETITVKVNFILARIDNLVFMIELSSSTSTVWMNKYFNFEEI